MIPKPYKAARRAGLSPRLVMDWFRGVNSPKLIDLLPILRACPEIDGDDLREIAERFERNHPKPTAGA